MDLQALLNDLLRETSPLARDGRVADYIPALARVGPERMGAALATVEGEVLAVGEAEAPFSIQSISKLFTLALVLARDGEALWARVGREPSGNPFNSLVQLEYEQGIPRNPFINAGALVVTDRLHGMAGDASVALLDFLRQESDNPTLAVDEEVARSEWEHSHRNHALAHFMASYGNLEHPVPAVPTAAACSPAARPSASTP